MNESHATFNGGKALTGTCIPDPNGRIGAACDNHTTTTTLKIAVTSHFAYSMNPFSVWSQWSGRNPQK
jgi:hypothetical protein